VTACFLLSSLPTKRSCTHTYSTCYGRFFGMCDNNGKGKCLPFWHKTTTHVNDLCQPGDNNLPFAAHRNAGSISFPSPPVTGTIDSFYILNMRSYQIALYGHPGGRFIVGACAQGSAIYFSFFWPLDPNLPLVLALLPEFIGRPRWPCLFNLNVMNDDHGKSLPLEPTHHGFRIRQN